MSLSVDKNHAFAKLESISFQTDVDLSTNPIIEFGDGVAMDVTTSSFDHTYTDFGIFEAVIKTCDQTTPSAGNSQKVYIKPFVEERIEFVNPPLSSNASSTEGIEFQVCLSSSCPPPLRVHLSTSGTISTPRDQITEDYLFDCTPKHYFETEETLINNVITLNNPSKIYINGEICGYHDTFRVRYYDDYPHNAEITAELERTCKLCDPELEFECPLAVYNVGYTPTNAAMVDDDFL